MSTSTGTPVTYTSIPISGADVISRSFQNLFAAVSSRRPWTEFVAAYVFHRPDSLIVAGESVRKNATYFRINYAILILGCAIISLVGTPISLMVWALILGMWLIFYFFREDPLFVGGRRVSDRLVLLCLVLGSALSVWFTGVLENMVVGVAIGLFLCCVHAVPGIHRRTAKQDLGRAFSVTNLYFAAIDLPFLLVRIEINDLQLWRDVIFKVFQDLGWRF